mmetsp:Transcript_23388/g.70076  ORF Transcript_23388/g.70076 Transcript_23388/m.70076 type:complete len:145 (-) Transcript_23388:38-472(-)
MARFLAVACLLAGGAAAFVRPHPRAAGIARYGADDPLPEVTPGEIDWDSEFSKLQKGEYDAAKARRNDAALDVQRAGRRAKRSVEGAVASAQSTASRAARSVPKAPRLSSDQTFWFGVLAAVALFPVLVSTFSGGDGMPPPVYV